MAMTDSQLVSILARERAEQDEVIYHLQQTIDRQNEEIAILKLENQKLVNAIYRKKRIIGRMKGEVETR